MFFLTNTGADQNIANPDEDLILFLSENTATEGAENLKPDQGKDVVDDAETRPAATVPPLSARIPVEGWSSKVITKIVFV